MAKSSEPTPAEVEIRSLVRRYSEAVNRRDPEAWSDTWSEGGRWELQGTETVGRPAIVARWLELMEAIPFVLQAPTFGVVTLGEDSTAATGRWYVNELSPRQLSEMRDQGYRLGDAIGRRGVEKTFEGELRGTDGRQTIVVDSKGRAQKSRLAEQLDESDLDRRGEAPEPEVAQPLDPVDERHHLAHEHCMV